MDGAGENGSTNGTEWCGAASSHLLALTSRLPAMLSMRVHVRACVCLNRSELLDLYRFECDCARCADELHLHPSASATATAAGASKAKAKERVSYATAASRERHAHKKGPPKRKKIEAKFQQQQPEES